MDTNIRAAIEVITPDIALEILGNHENNRNLRPRFVTSYARDMAAGNWTLNGESIKIDVNGNLIDGQHRLNAVIQAGVSVQMMVIRGLASETQTTVDLGLRRNGSDMLSMKGEKHAAIMSAALRRLVLREQGYNMIRSAQAPTMAECLNFLDANPRVRRSCQVAVEAHCDRILPPSATATVHFLTDKISPEQALWFFARLGDEDVPHGHPIRVMRAKVISARLSGHRPNTDECVAYLIHAWNLYRKGRTVQILRPVSGPLSNTNFPTPI